MTQLSVIIPCYNEASSIDSILTAVRNAPIEDKEMMIVRCFFVCAATAVVDLAGFGVLAVVLGLPWFPAAGLSFVLQRHTFQQTESRM